MKTTILTFVTAALFATGCCRSKDQPLVTEKREISRLFMHRPGEYSVLAKAGDNSLESIDLNVYKSNKVHIVADVPADQPMYYDKTGDLVVVHIRSGQDVDGGASKNGKQPEVKTNPVQ